MIGLGFGDTISVNVAVAGNRNHSMTISKDDAFRAWDIPEPVGQSLPRRVNTFTAASPRWT